MGEPGVGAGVRLPVPRRALDAFQGRQQREILGEPAFQQAPLPQQRLVRGLDRDDAGLRARGVALGVRVGRQQPLLDQEVDQRRRLVGNFRASRDVAARALRIRVDAGEPGDQAAAQQRLARAPLPRNPRVGVGADEGARDRGIDRALQAAEILVVLQPQRALAAPVEEQLLQREGEQRQRVAAGALLDVLEQPLASVAARSPSAPPASVKRRAGPSITSL